MESLLLFFSLIYLSFAADTTWNYNRCDPTYGPSAWGGSCQTGKEQTPVNLCGANVFTTSPSLTVAEYKTARKMEGFNTGYLIQINVPSDATYPTVTSNLAWMVGRSTDTTTPTWKLAQMHVHFGRTDKTTEGSEHYLEGKAYPMEAHFVHWNSKYTTISDALSKVDGLLVIGVFLEVKDTESALITAIGNAVATMTKTPKSLASDVTLSDLYDGTGDYYAYKGGLTTPNCNEIVSWMVMKDTKGITLATLNKFKAATTNPTASAQKFAVQATDEIQGKYGNFRPLQAINGRSIWTSVAGATPTTCTTPANPFTCSSGVLFRPKAVITLLMLGMWLSATH